MRHWGLVVVVWAHGCAFRQAMREGEELAAAGDWAGAYAAYSAALEKKPDHPGAEQALNEAREFAVEDALTAARAAIDTADYETAKKSLDEVARFDPDNPEVFDLARDLERTMAAHFERLWQANDPNGAYDFAIRARGIVPKADHVQENVDRVRAYFAAEAERLSAANEHPRALALLQVIAQHEPDRKSELVAAEQKIRLSWADHLVATSASLAKAGRTGAAAVQLARAYEIAGRAGDLDQARALATSLATQARFSVTVDVTGDAWRVLPVKDALTKGITALPDAPVLVSSDPVLAVRMTLRPHKCTEADTVTPATLEYVSGQVEKPNATWNELAAAYEQARKEEAAARARVNELAPKVEAATSATAKLDAAVAQLEKLFADVTAAFEEANQHLSAARTRRDELEAQYDQLLASGGGADTKALEAQIAEARSIMDQWAAKATETEQAEALAKRKLDEIRAQRGAATEALEQLRAAHAAAEQDRAAAEQVAADLTAKLSNTPKTVWEEVRAVHTYDVHDWKRTCVAPAALSMRPRWKTQLGTARNFDPSATIEDRAWSGFAKANLPADPKQYPTSDKELVALADAETVKAVVEWTGTLADDAYRDRISATLLAIEAAPVDAATAVIALMLGAPRRLDEATVGAFHAYLKEEFGLEQPALLADAAP